MAKAIRKTHGDRLIRIIKFCSHLSMKNQAKGLAVIEQIVMMRR